MIDLDMVVHLSTNHIPERIPLRIPLLRIREAAKANPPPSLPSPLELSGHIILGIFFELLVARPLPLPALSVRATKKRTFCGLDMERAKI